MYSMWPGCYSFREELGLFAVWVKEQVDALVAKIYKFDQMVNGL